MVACSPRWPTIPFAVGIGLDEDTAAFIGPDEHGRGRGQRRRDCRRCQRRVFHVHGHRERGPAGLPAGPHAAHARRWRDVQPAHAAGPGRVAVGSERIKVHSQGRKPGMRILDRSVYVGPSLYAHFPVIRLELDLGVLEQWPTGRLGDAFVDGLVAALPGLAEHGCSYREPGGFFRRMREDEGTWLGHVLEHVAIELQNIAGEERHLRQDPQHRHARRLHRGLRVRAARRRHRGGRTRVAPAVFAAAGGTAPRRHRTRGLELARGARRVHPLRAAARAGPVHGVARARGRSTRHPVAAAQRPVAGAARPWPLPAAHPGHRHRAALRTSRSNSRATRKKRTRSSSTLGLPVPLQELVQSETQAARAARRIGFPVVTKPYNGNHGRGISIKLTSEEEVVQGYRVAREHSRSVIVETYLEGDDHRLLVVNGELVAATRRTPGHVVGDGTKNIVELIEVVNQDPRRGVGHEKVLTRLELDAQAQKMLEKARADGRVGAGAGPDRLPALHREPVDGRHRDRRHRRHPPRQPRDGRARRAGGRTRRRRRRFPVHRHHRELPQDRWRHLRGERRAGLPHARGAE